MGGGGRGGRRASAATQGPQAGAENPQPGCQPALAVCREPLYRQKSPSREGAGSGGSYEVPEVRGSRGRRVHATNSPAGATLVRARQDVKRARQASAPAHLSQTHSIPGGVLAVGVDGWGSARREWLLSQQKTRAWEEGKVFCFGP